MSLVELKLAMLLAGASTNTVGLDVPPSLLMEPSISARAMQLSPHALIITMPKIHVQQFASVVDIFLAEISASATIGAELGFIAPNSIGNPTGAESYLQIDVSSSTPEPNDDEMNEDIVVTARPRHQPGDPLAALNIASFELSESVDKAIIRPVALTFRRVVPEPIEDGMRNILRNLKEPVVFLNFLLQLKIGKAAATLGRFTINSTIGVGGVLDMAKRKPFNLPLRSNGFANTLGYYGVKPGAYLFLPLIGPTTVRDLIGRSLDLLTLPVAVGKPFNQSAYTIPAGIISSLDKRARKDEQIQSIREESDDPYTSHRELYLRGRQAEIDALRGKQADQNGRPSVASKTSNTVNEIHIAPVNIKATPKCLDPVFSSQIIQPETLTAESSNKARRCR